MCACEEWSCGVTPRVSIPEPAVAVTVNASTPSTLSMAEIMSAFCFIGPPGSVVDGRA
jgi:hypothetical protein